MGVMFVSKGDIGKDEAKKVLTRYVFVYTVRIVKLNVKVFFLIIACLPVSLSMNCN